ncbi:MAG: hypothetical protein H6719_11040 [Sandaracinaceae bacterium]|nr:hypothetical protein [Sandaracinaceae bacterium]
MRHSLALALPLLIACSPPAWEVVQEDLPGALLSVWGTSSTDIWAVGGDVGSGPQVMRYDGTEWRSVDTGHTGSLWWVFGFAGGPVYMGGEGGAILRYQDGVFTPMTTPGTETVFGIWGASPDDLWAVGGASDAAGGFAWRLEGDAWVEEPTLPAEVPTMAAIWKVSGRATDDVWLVGSNGVSLHWDGSSLTPGATGVGSSLFTVSANAQRFAAVGGLTNGILVEDDGDGWHNVTPDNTLPSLSGIVLGEGDEGFAVGNFGTILERDGGGWHELATELAVAQNLHAVWLDPDGGVWAVGGRTFSLPLNEGVMVHRPAP